MDLRIWYETKVCSVIEILRIQYIDVCARADAWDDVCPIIDLNKFLVDSPHCPCASNDNGKNWYPCEKHFCCNLSILCWAAFCASSPWFLILLYGALAALAMTTSKTNLLVVVSFYLAVTEKMYSYIMKK